VYSFETCLCRTFDAVAYYSHVCRRSPHIEANDAVAVPRRAYHACRGSGHYCADGAFGDPFGAHHAAVRRHHPRLGRSDALESFDETVQVRLDGRCYVRVDDCSRGAFVLAELGENVRRDRDVDVELVA